MSVDIVPYLKEVLQDELKRDDRFMPVKDLKEALNENNKEASPREGIFGYPTRPIYREVGHMLQIWLETKKCPVLELPTYDLLDESGYKETRASNIASITPLLEGLESLWDLWTKEERKFRIREVILILGKRGLLDLLGLRKTVGTMDTWLPAREILENTFQAKHSDKAALSVGARALAKHGHRDESASWWGCSTGTERAKNDHATSVMKRILDNARWINIHVIVHDVELVEVRQQDGYGVRWTLNGEEFRGFLEPQMEGGHDVGWRH